MIPSSIDPEDPVALTSALVRCPSVTPKEGGALALLEAVLARLGFEVHRPVFEQDGTAPVENLFAVLRGEGSHLTFAGHTDVVPPGNASDWTYAPFSGAVKEDVLYGRGSVDMKGGIAAFVAAVARRLSREPFGGTVSLLITGDEEGPAVNGTVKLLQCVAKHGERFDAAIVGEPTSTEHVGDTIKIGRRGSLTGTLTVRGTQGHAAYPDKADNPLRGMTVLLDVLLREPLDEGTDEFQASNLEVTTVDVGNTATNVIPAKATATFNVRHNDLWTSASLREEIERRLRNAANTETPLRRKEQAIEFTLEWREPASPCFLTKDDALIDGLANAVQDVTGRRPQLSTGGGTSDARFIKDHCPVVELGVVGTTMHQVNERVPTSELHTLAAIYSRFLDSWFAR